MRHQVRPRVECLENKTLLSHLAAGLVAHHPALHAEVHRPVSHKPSVVHQPESHRAHPADAPGYVWTSPLDDPSAGTTGTSYQGIPYVVQGSFLLGINDRGQISGNYGDPNNLTHGLLLSHGRWTSFDDPSAGTVPILSMGFFPGTDAVKANNQGQIVGFYIAQNNVEHSFVLSGGRFTTIDPPGAVNNPGPTFTNVDQAADINDPGQIVGGYTDKSGDTHGYLLCKGRYTALDDPSANGVFTFADAINNGGQIVGIYSNQASASTGTTGVVHSFLLSDGHYYTLDDPNAGQGAGQGTFAEGINNYGQITGYYVDGAGNVHGFVLSHGQYTTLNDPDPAAAGGIIPAGINDEGQIVGFYIDGKGLAHGFLATPTY
jgi:uncharacterized membrane protein